MDEAPLEDKGSGLAPAGPGWFVVNVRDAQWLTSEGGEKKRYSNTPAGVLAMIGERPAMIRRSHQIRNGIAIAASPIAMRAARLPAIPAALGSTAEMVTERLAPVTRDATSAARA